MLRRGRRIRIRPPPAAMSGPSLVLRRHGSRSWVSAVSTAYTPPEASSRNPIRSDHFTVCDPSRARAVMPSASTMVAVLAM